jgi:hypothetical protein
MVMASEKCIESMFEEFLSIADRHGYESKKAWTFVTRSGSRELFKLAEIATHLEIGYKTGRSYHVCQSQQEADA